MALIDQIAALSAMRHARMPVVTGPVIRSISSVL
jgi:acyl-CoA hydrolase